MAPANDFGEAALAAARDQVARVIRDGDGDEAPADQEHRGPEDRTITPAVRRGLLGGSNTN